MRQKNETATSFNQLKEITQAIQVQKASAKISTNAHTSEPTQAKSALTPKTRARAKNHALKPTKRAFSERQITTIRDNSPASDHKRLETQQSDKQGDNANAFKSDETTQHSNQKQPRKPKRGQE
ncbi:hypothetical protein ACLGB9_05930 [Helicobacter pylori]